MPMAEASCPAHLSSLPAAFGPASDRWGANTRKTRTVLYLIAGVCALLPFGMAIAFLSLFLNNQPLSFPFTDFFAFWSFGAFAIENPVALLYDNAVLHAFQDHLAPQPGSYPYLYPPPIMLVLEPLGMLPYGVACTLWTVLGIAAYVWALSPWHWPRPVLACLLVAPAPFVCGLIGQNGFWTAAMMLGGLRLLRDRPFVAGVLLGVLAYKPPIALLVPLYLIAGGRWRALLAAGATGVALFVATSAIFGADFWFSWIDAMLGQAHALATTRGHLNGKMPTVTATVSLYGGGAALANTLQGISAAFAAWAVWRFAKVEGAVARAILPVATILATPHAFYYDLPMVTGAVLAVIAERMTSRDASTGAGSFSFSELLSLIAAIVAPLPVAHSGQNASLALLSMIALLVVLVRRSPTSAQTAGQSNCEPSALRMHAVAAE